MGMLVWLGLFSWFSSECVAGNYSTELLLIDMKIVMDYTFLSVSTMTSIQSNITEFTSISALLV